MRRLRIVVADDEAIIRLGLSTMLAALGHEALLAPNGREALNLVRTARPDLALLDIQMPLTNGLEAAKVIARSHPMPVIILTAYSEASLLEKAAALPIQGYLVKPVTERDLAAAIEVAVARFEDARAREAEIAELKDSLEARKWVDRAKGKLMQTGLSEEDAYLALQRRAREQRVTLKEAAEAVLRQGSEAKKA
jgi:response regulator NasT